MIDANETPYYFIYHSIPAPVHWLSIANSLVIVIVLSTINTIILVRNLRRDFSRYNRLVTDEERADELEEFGWKLVHADVFRPPSFSPLLLSAACGTGAQLLCMLVLTAVLFTLGLLSQANREVLVITKLLLYASTGVVAGFVAARFYNSFDGNSWQKVVAATTCGFPGFASGLMILMNIVASWKGSLDAVPVTTIIVRCAIWFGISTPLVFFGAYFGHKQGAIEYPVKTSSIPRRIPDQPWFMNIPFTLLAGGVLPVGACFIEMYFIMASLWMDQYTYIFASFLLVFMILIVTCVEVTVLFNYFQLCGENYHWWWRSFCCAGSTGLYVFFYSFAYVKFLESEQLATYLFYFGYMALVSLGVFLLMGFVGLSSCLWFNKTIYGSIKID